MVKKGCVSFGILKKMSNFLLTAFFNRGTITFVIIFAFNEKTLIKYRICCSYQERWRDVPNEARQPSIVN